jgi:hypothetical protein
MLKEWGGSGEFVRVAVLDGKLREVQKTKCRWYRQGCPEGHTNRFKIRIWRRFIRLHWKFWQP